MATRVIAPVLSLLGRPGLALFALLTTTQGCAGPMRSGGDELTGSGQYREPAPPPPPPPPTERSFALLGRRVSLVAPLAWRVAREEYTPRSALIELSVPRGDSRDTRADAEVRLRAELTSDDAPFAVDADARRAAILAERADGPDWRTVVSADDHDPPRAIVERIGRARGARVHLHVTLPLANGDDRWASRLTREVNAVIGALTIDGLTRFDSPITLAPP